MIFMHKVRGEFFYSSSNFTILALASTLLCKQNLAVVSLVLS